MLRSDSPSRASGWEWAQAALLASNLAWTTLCLGGFLASTMVVTSTLTFALVLVHTASIGGPLLRKRPAGAPQAVAPLNRAFWWLAPFLVCALANVLWVTPVRWLGWIDWFGWFELIAVFAVVTNGVRSRGPQILLLGTLIGLALVAVVLGAYQHFVAPNWMMLGRVQATQYSGRASGCFGIPNSLAALLLLLLPITGALTFRRGADATARVLFGWVTLVLLFGLGLTISRGAWIGLALALIAWPVLASRGPWHRRALRAFAAAGAVVVAAALAIGASPSVRERFTELVHDLGERSRPILWRAAWGLFREHPVFGSGAGSFDTLFEKFRPEGFLLRPRWAHNDYLNTLSDYGALGFVLFFGAAAVVGWRTWRGDRRRAGKGSDARSEPRRPRATFAWEDPLVRQAAAVGLLAFALQLFVDFHFKIPALALAFATVAGVVVARPPHRDRAQPDPEPNGEPTRAERAGYALVLVALAIGAAWIVVPQYAGEALRSRARARVDRLAQGDPSPEHVRAELDQVQPTLARATAIAPDNAQAWSDESYVLAQRSRLDPATQQRLGRDAEAAADRALELAPVCAEFWVRRGVARDIQNRWAEAGEDFAKAATLSPTAVLPWYHLAYHYALRDTGTDMAEALTSYCLRLDPLNRESQRLRQKLATRHSGS